MKRKMELKLENPPVKTYHHLAFPFSVLDQNSDIWLYSNFIQLKCENNIPAEDDMYFDFLKSNFFNDLECPFLELVSIHRSYVEINYNNIHDFFEFYIQEGYYIYLFLNVFYLPNVNDYQKSLGSHDILIFGFDKGERQYNLSGYAKNHLFSQWKVSYSHIEDAFLNMNALDIPVEQYKIILFRKKFPSVYAFNYPQLASNLEDYLNSSTREDLPPYKNQNHLIFGLETYDILLAYIELLANKKIKFDIRPFCLLEEHKSLMTKRVKFLFELCYLKKNFEKWSNLIRYNSLIMRNLMLKYSITRNIAILKEVRSILIEMKKDDQNLITNILFELYNYPGG
ncbi:hypothetical protein [Paenibacillus phocaensis]|uniref:hypothetical protein n=1 Tax=Paenibacillus phocaensis TaxID=1776378 RepID=UPI000839C1EF|nr:hypothetical protein [Paenibacillus phocaensis]